MPLTAPMARYSLTLERHEADTVDLLESAGLSSFYMSLAHPPMWLAVHVCESLQSFQSHATLKIIDTDREAQNTDLSNVSSCRKKSQSFHLKSQKID